MYKKEFTFIDFFGKERTETHYFNLTESEVTKWLTTEGDYTLDKVLERMMEKNNSKDLVQFIEDLICRSYGEISLDGRKFEKSEKILSDFKGTKAYSDLFMELISDGKASSEFVMGIMPDSLEDQIKKIISENPDEVPENLKEAAAVFTQSTPIPLIPEA